MTQATHRKAGLGLAAAILILDQLVKWAIIGPVALREKGLVTILPIFDLRWVENYGVSMGFLVAGSNAERWLLVGMTALIATGVGVWMARETNRAEALALGAVLGGALGNIVDRVRFGYVIDYLDLHFGDWHPFLVFNVADAAISLGVVLLVLRALFTREKNPAENENA